MTQFDDARKMAREAKTPGQLADAMLMAQHAADEQIDKVEKAIRADERRLVIEHIRERTETLAVENPDDYNAYAAVAAILDDLSTPEQKR
jgi:hypothetical protein